MLNEGGALSLWRGNGINVMKVGPEAALRFMFYEEVKNNLLFEYLVSGFFFKSIIFFR